MLFFLAIIPWALYGISKNAFRRHKNHIFFYGIACLLLGIFYFMVSDEEIFSFSILGMPITTYYIVIKLEGHFYRRYGREIRETAFWYIGNGYRTKEENFYNPLILIAALILPFLLCLIIIPEMFFYLKQFFMFYPNLLD